MRYITDVTWHVNMDRAIRKIFGMDGNSIAEALHVPYQVYAKWDTASCYDRAYEVYGESPEKFAELMELPEEPDIPEGLTDRDEITDWIYEEYGCFPESFRIAALPA